MQSQISFCMLDKSQTLNLFFPVQLTSSQLCRF